MDTAALIDKRKTLVLQLVEIRDAGKAEKRKLSKVEIREFNKIKGEIEQIDAQLAGKVTDPGKRTITVKKDESRFSLIKSIRDIAEGRSLDETAAGIMQLGLEESRAAGVSSVGQIHIPVESRAVIAALTDGGGQEIVPEQKLNLIEPLRNNLVLVQAGATMLSGLVGDVSMPSYSGSAVAWKGENVTAGDGAGSTDEVTLSPKRLTGFIDVSKQLLLQDSINAEALLLQDIVNAISEKYESTVLGKLAGSATQPAGIFYTAPDVKGSASWANIVALETTVDAANAKRGKLAYITHPTAVGKLKTTAKATNQAIFLIDPDGKMNGYPVLPTSGVATALQTGADEYGIVFGDWTQYLIGQWGAIDLLIDPYTQAALGAVRIHVNAYMDGAMRRTASFKTGSLK